MGRTFSAGTATLLVVVFTAAMAAAAEPLASLPRWDDEQLAALGLRKVVGDHLTLYTDAPSRPTIDELPQVFDRAIPQWCQYFRVAESRTEDWRIVGYLMVDRDRFRSAGILRKELPEFTTGYQLGPELWLYDQKSDYYRRHLFLHEGTHAFMNHFLGGSGPPWYTEGMAELLATHHWSDGQLVLKYLPKSREESPGWGRIKIVRDAVERLQPLSLVQITQYRNTAHRELEPYGWCWAATTFLDDHPRWQAPFRQLVANARETGPEFSDRLLRQLESNGSLITHEWQLFVLHLDYGYDVAPFAIEPKPSAPLPTTGATVRIRADRGWQSSGLTLAAGRTYEIEAAGRYRVGESSKPWMCEPNGITLHYYRGRPLGLLLGAVMNEEEDLTGLTPLATPDAIGLGLETTPERSGTAYFCINEFPGNLKDNSGEIEITIREK